MKIIQSCLITLFSTSFLILNAAQPARKRKRFDTLAGHIALQDKKQKIQKDALLTATLSSTPHPSSRQIPPQLLPKDQNTLAFDPQALLSAVMWETIINGYVDAKKCTVFSDHKQFVYDVRFSPDGSSMASTGCGGYITVRDTKSDVIHHRIPAHDKTVYSLDYNKNGSLLASTSSDHTIQLRNTKTGLLKTALYHAETMFVAKFHPEGRQLASGGTSHDGDNCVHIWDIEKEIIASELHGHTNRVQDIIWFQDGTTLASFADDSTIRLWDSRSGTIKRIFPACRRWEGHLLASTPGDRNLAWLSNDGIAIADLRKNTFLNTLPRPQQQLFTSLALSHEDNPRLAATTNREGTVYVYDVARGTCTDTLKHKYGSLQAISFSPNNKSIVATDRTHNILLWRQTDLIEQFKDASGQAPQLDY